jgi:hypothetical protein
MNTCRELRGDRAAFLNGELSPERIGRLGSHLEGCPACREEVEGMKRVIGAAGLVKDEMEKEMASVAWESLPALIADRVLSAERRPRRSRGIGSLLFPSGHPVLRPAFAGAALGLVAGALVMFFVMRRPAPQAARGGFFASPEFIERAESELARRETLDYLRNSQYLILDFVQSPPGEAASRMDLAASGRARDLLARKKYLNAQLDGSRMGKAKAICDQIELLFLELSRLGEGLPEAEILRIQRLIEDSRLLLKINLVEKELEESEA